MRLTNNRTVNRFFDPQTYKLRRRRKKTYPPSKKFDKTGSDKKCRNGMQMQDTQWTVKESRKGDYDESEVDDN